MEKLKKIKIIGKRQVKKSQITIRKLIQIEITELEAQRKNA